MQLGIFLFVITDITNYLVAKGLLKSDGSVNNLSIGQDIEIVQVVEASLKAHGVVIKSEVDKVIAVLPLVLQLAGIK